MTVGELNVEIGAKLDKLERALGKMEGEIKGAGKSAERSTQASFTKVGGFIAAAFSVQAIQGFVGAIIKARGEFERFGAVLTNTLGSESAANEAIKQITDFASKTPFAVNELTNSYVKLANQGFRPTLEQMRRLGDLASSTGKGFDQLTEAILDAQVGEFERLKEFGIRASAEGDKVMFTFKGVTTEVDRTETAMRNYILGLGDAQGVTGAMAAISETLEGKISNLGDSWNSLLITLGNTKVLKESVSALSEFVSSLNQAIVDFTFNPIALSEENFKALEQGLGRSLTTEERAKALQGFTKEQVKLIEAVKDGSFFIEQEKKRVEEGRMAMEQYAKELEKVNNIERPKPTKDEIDAWHNLGTIAYLTSEVMKDAWGSASEVSISGPMVEMDRLVDPEMEAAMMGLGEQIAVLKEKVDSYNESLAIASETGAIFGGVLQSSFEAALISGESFFDVFIDGLKNMVSQLIAAAATAAILSAVLSTFMPGLGFGAAFGRVAGGMGGGGGTLGGIFKLFGTDLVASTGRTTGQQARFN